MRGKSELSLGFGIGVGVVVEDILLFVFGGKVAFGCCLLPVCTATWRLVNLDFWLRPRVLLSKQHQKIISLFWDRKFDLLQNK